MIWMFLTGCAIVVACAAYLLQRISALENRAIDRFDSEFQKLNVRIEELSGAIAFSQLPEWRKELARFQKLPELTIESMRGLKPGSIIPLVSKEYAYPSERPLIIQFDYKHERIIEVSSDPSDVEVHGLSKLTPSSFSGAPGAVDHDWTPFSFVAATEGSSPSIGSGVIKKGHVRDEG